jgi:hypothetical protein
MAMEVPVHLFRSRHLFEDADFFSDGGDVIEVPPFPRHPVKTDGSFKSLPQRVNTQQPQKANT